MKKEDFSTIMKKYEPVVKKTGEQLSKVVKAAEEDISKMYRIAQNHVEIQMKNLQEEKLYHELGKFVAKKILAGDDNFKDLEKYKTRLDKIESGRKKIKNKLTRISSLRVKKSQKTKKGE